MATNKTPPLYKVPMSNTENDENRRRRPKRRKGDKFYGSMQGFINRAHNRGDVVAFDETVYMGNAGGSYEPPQVPSSRPKPQEEEDSSDYSEYSDDGRREGASFYGPMTGIVNEARGTGNATAFKRTIHHGSSRESTLVDSPVASRDIQQPLRSQEETERNIIRSSNQELIKYPANGFQRTSERHYPPELEFSGNGATVANASYVGSSRENALINSPGASYGVQRRLLAQGENEFAESRSITRGLNQEPIKIHANDFQRKSERQYVQNRAGPSSKQDLNTDGLNQEFDTERLNEEFQRMSFEMQDFVAGLVRQSSQSADDEDER